MYKSNNNYSIIKSYFLRLRYFVKDTGFYHYANNFFLINKIFKEYNYLLNSEYGDKLSKLDIELEKNYIANETILLKDTKDYIKIVNKKVKVDKNLNKKILIGI